MTPRAVIFDYGCVLSQPQDPAALERMAEILGVDTAALAASYWSHRLRYDRADLNAGMYWRQVAADTGAVYRPSLLPALVECDNRSWADPNPDMLPWVERLRGAGVRTGLLSNMPLDLRLYIEQNVNWLPEFDHRTFSCDVRLSKPEAAIYEHCLEGLGVEPEHAIFFDDREENVAAAERLGIQARLFVTAGDAAPELDIICRR